VPAVPEHDCGPEVSLGQDELSLPGFLELAGKLGGGDQQDEPPAHLIAHKGQTGQVSVRMALAISSLTVASKDRAALLENVTESMQFLISSANSFDKGYEAEAKRLAVTLRVLLHDTVQSHSLLGLLGVKERMKFTNTAAQIEPDNVLPTLGLVTMMPVRGTPRYVAPLGNLAPPAVRPPADFSVWWNNDVTKDKYRNLWSRKSFVLTLANKEGGAHVDPSLTDKYEVLVRRNGLAWQTNSPEGLQSLQGSPAAAAVRQVTYEVLETLKRHSSLLS
jgi:hypothetical protein